MKKTNIIWAMTLLILFIILGIIVFPKTVYTVVDEKTIMNCECYGSEFWFGTKCVGFPYNCQESTINDWRKPCEEPSCSTVFNRLAEDGSFEKNKYRNTGTDVVLVIDSSNSMDSAKLLAAKQAAQGLVSELKDGERIGVISFSENATIINEFSSDKRTLTEGIMSISVSGGTNYLPALELIDTLFLKEHNQARKGVIFLTDGNPSDNKTLILNKAKLIYEKDISLFAISFGLENDEMSILEEMIQQTTTDEEFNNRFKSFSDSNDIITAFYEAWQEIANLELISFQGIDNNLIVSQKETPFIGFETYLDNTKISLIDHEKSLCVPQLKVEASLVQNNSIQNISLDPNGDRFFFPNTIPAGTYNISLSAMFRSNHNGSCLFSGEDTIYNFTIHNKTEECRILSCDETKESLEDFDLAALKGAVLPRDNNFGRVVILMDTSESMKPYFSQVIRAVDRLSRLFSIGDERALITFSDKAQLIVPLTRDKNDFTLKLDSLVPQGTTKIIPALQKANYLFKYNKTDHDIVVIISDGLTYDTGGEKNILTEASKVINEGSCVYVFGYGKELANEPRAADVFRSITKYSSKELDCGEYIYTPNVEELSYLVTQMFGGIRPGNETLRVVVDRQENNNAGSLAITIKIVSSKTGIQLPYVMRDGCVSYPQTQIALVHRGNTIPLQTEYLIDGSIKIITPHLFPGKYTLQVVASIPLDGCDIVEEYTEEFILFGPPTNASEAIITIIILLLASMLIVISREIIRK